jgi:hypothetical protein
MTHRAAATALSGAYERVHHHPAATDEPHRQGHRDPHLAPSARHPAAANRKPASDLGRPRSARHAPAPAPPPTTETVTADRLSRHRPALAPRPHPPPSRRPLPPKTTRPAADPPSHPVPRPAPGAGEPQLGYRRVHGELITLGVSVAASTVWEIFKQHGIEPAPQRGRQTWADFLRSQAHAILACDFFTAATLTGTTYYVFVVIEHASRRIRVLGVTTHPTADWTTQMARNLISDLQDAGAALKYLIRDRDSNTPARSMPSSKPKASKSSSPASAFRG